MEAEEIIRLKEDLISQIKLKYESADSNAKNYGETAVLSASVEFPFEPLTWLAAQKLYPKIYWSGREDDSEYYGAGTADLITSDSPGSVSGIMREVQVKLSGTKGLKYFGYTRFNTTEENTGPEWERYKSCCFCLPKFVAVKLNDRTVLNWLCVFKDNNIDELIKQFNRDFEALNFNHLEFMSHGKAELNRGKSQERELWDESVNKVLDMISDDKLEKVVLSRKLDLVYPHHLEPLSFMQYFQRMKSPAYFFCFQPGEDTAFIGSSPERLYYRNNDRIYSEALAGTRKRGSTEAEDNEIKEAFLNDPKDCHEHNLVFRHIESLLSEMCEDVEKDPQNRIMSLIKIQHLYRKISGVLKPGSNDGELIAKFHPTPAVAGTPVEKAVETIRALESFDRGLYCGPVGLISGESAEFTVGIRSGLIHDNILSLYCGAGIVKGSVPEKEWEEVENKFGNFIEVIEQTD